MKATTTSLPSPQQILLLITCLFSLCAFDVFLQKQARTVSVSADKMNVFYVGVDNPITVAVAGVPSEKVGVSSDDVKLVSLGDGRYNVQASKPGLAALLVHGEGFEPKEMLFRVKRIPDPVAVFDLPGGNYQTFSAEEFKGTLGIKALLENFEFETKTDIAEFTLTRVSPGNDPLEARNEGAYFSKTAQAIVQQAMPGDTYYFDKILVKMEDDQSVPRKLGGIVVKIR